jgi:hypothetical protein
VPKKLDIPKLLHALGIEATQRGREWVALCPNPKHHDRHPSWRIKDSPLSSKHGFHKCHPCGFGGGPAELVRVVRDFAEISSALQWLKDFRKGEQEEEQVDAFRWETMSLTKRAFVLPPEVVVEELSEWPSVIREYAQLRGITEEQVERYGIGYAVFGKLAGRIVLPARDVHGAPRNYTSRSFVGHQKRYLAADISEKPDLGCMFGEQFWPPTARRRAVVVLEGAINGLTVDRAVPELPFGVIDGSEPRPAHFMKLATFPQVYILTDPDKAGAKAAETLAMGLGRHSIVTRVTLPPGVDAQAAGDAKVKELLEPCLAH